jgi:molybdopterin-containing oxidoreductase family iron-sulfur binding subunit
MSRRQFLYAGGATLALASQALAGCTRAPAEKIVPYRLQPSDVVPGRATHYATASTLDGFGTGIIVESHEGRPTKIEGNPGHPASLGASSAFEQALLIELYDPARLRGVTRRGLPESDAALDAALARAADTKRAGRGLHIVLPPVSSPLLASQLARLSERLPGISVHFHAPLTRLTASRGAQLAFGAPLETRADLRRAKVILSLDADVLATGPGHLARAREFSDQRRMNSARDEMNRLYVAETTMSVTGGMADHRLALRPSEIPLLAGAVLHEVANALGASAPGFLEQLAGTGGVTGLHLAFVRALARDLILHRGNGAVLVGEQQPAVVHAAAHALNVLLGNAGTVVSYAPSPIVACGGPEHDSLAGLRDALASHAVETLIVLDTNLAYASPAAFGLAQLINAAPESFYLGQFEDATAAACTWVIPRAHVLESWADTRAFDGTTSIVQPLLSPLYGGRTESQIFSILLGEMARSAHDLVRDFWRSARKDDEEFWELALMRGVVEGSAIAPVATPELRWDWTADLPRFVPSTGIELNLRRDPSVFDGRFGDNPWLLELPCPVTKLTWGNAACLGPALAARLQIETGDVLALEVDGQRLEVPALVVPGHAEQALTLTLGWGRRGPGLGAGHGSNAYSLMKSTLGWSMPVAIHRSRKTEELAVTQAPMSLGEVESSILVHATLSDYRKQGQLGQEQRRKQLSLYASDTRQAERQWGMTIDLNACIGCSACVIACQAENNIPPVGKSGVLKHREMHWLRIDRYVAGDAREPRILVQPMACQHCEKAPCEYVCPTGATVHSSDGLNQMVYNRCVGTRFCSNNCPYKVRRFNWFDYHQAERSPTELAYNPEVTVRARGVMEKCTYCVQRIRKAEIRERTESKPLLDGDIQTACEQACPTRAIRFGDVADKHSEVSRLRAGDRSFAVLNELGTVPRTRYLAKLTNPNPELA